MTHIIYHIPDVKVGCTNDFERRKSEYPEGTQFEIIEVLEGFTDKEAGDREWDWADHYSYPRGTHYTHTKMMNEKGAIKGGIATTDKYGGWAFITPEQLSANGKKGGERCHELNPELASNNGKLVYELGYRPLADYLKNCTPEEHFERRKKGIQTARQNGTIGNSGRLNGHKQALIEHVCPHCGKVGNGNTMFRHHFERCKYI